LRHIAPIQALKNWQDSHPHLFIKRVLNQPGHDNYPRVARPHATRPVFRIDYRSAS
jgi:hypothetical protein